MPPSNRMFSPTKCFTRIQALICLILLPLSLTGALAQDNQPREQTWCTNGAVNAMARYGNTIYIGGNFTSVFPYTGHGLPISRSSEQIPASYAKITGTTESVSACVSDGSGGWYIGGRFAKVGNTPRRNIAHIQSDGSLDLAWDPGTSGTISALDFTSSTLYVGGWFTGIGGAPRKNIAALDVATGLATNWDPGADRGISALAISGREIYIGGEFKNIGGQPRSCIAAIDTSTGLATSWNPSAEDSSWPSVGTIAVSGSTVYVGGYFTKIGGQARASIAAIDTSTSLATAWDPKAEGWVPGKPNGYFYTPTIRAIAVSSSTDYTSPTIYVGGRFTKIGGKYQKHIAALSALTATASSWYPRSWAANQYYTAGGGEVNAIVLSGSNSFWNPSTVYVGTDNGILGSLDSWGDASTNWEFGRADGSVEALAISGDSIYAGGHFLHSAGKSRYGIAAIDAPTGRPTSWNPHLGLPGYPADPSVPGTVYALVATSSTIYAGGDFGKVGAVWRSGIAEIDASSGYATSWNPSAKGVASGLINPEVHSILLSGSTIYAGGTFSGIGGAARNAIAALDTSSGLATSWDPNPDDIAYFATIYALALSGRTVYAGGCYFANIGGQKRTSLVALDAATGLAIPWNPNPTCTSSVGSEIDALAAWGSTIYVGGRFTNIAGKARNGIAALDAITGLATQWDPVGTCPTTQSATIRSITISPSTVYVGRWFAGVSAIDIASGEATPWSPLTPLASSDSDYSGGADALMLFGQTLYVGGSFATIGGLPQSNFAQFDNVPPAPTTASDWGLYR